MGRHVAIYFSWSRPREIGAPLHRLENRYPTLLELRRLAWPHLEGLSDPARYNQDISGFLDHVVLADFEAFAAVARDVTGHPATIIQREGDRPPVQELDDDFLGRFDTLIVVSLDHRLTGQRPSAGEVEAIRHFLSRDGTCLVVCPHHDVGRTGGPEDRLRELRHHGDAGVPSQQRIGGFATELLAALGLPIENRYGLRPATVKGNPDQPAPLDRRLDEDSLGILCGVTTFNRHPHLPHLWMPPGLERKVRLLARQPIEPGAGSHPFTDSGNRYLNALLWAPPAGDRAGQILVGDATLWSSAFGGLDSLKVFWRNLLQL